MNSVNVMIDIIDANRGQGGYRKIKTKKPNMKKFKWNKQKHHIRGSLRVDLREMVKVIDHGKSKDQAKRSHPVIAYASRLLPFHSDKFRDGAYNGAIPGLGIIVGTFIFTFSSLKSSKRLREKNVRKEKLTDEDICHRSKPRAKLRTSMPVWLAGHMDRPPAECLRGFSGRFPMWSSEYRIIVKVEEQKEPGSTDSILSRLRENLMFLLYFARHPVKIGAPLPCSRGIAETVMVELIAKWASRVIELGAGLGSLTGDILEALGHGTRLLCIESEPKFCRHLNRRFGRRIKLFQGNALQIQAIVRRTAWEKADAIVSSVPLANRSAMLLCEQIAELLSPDGLYLQVANFYTAVEAHFNIEKIHYFLKNVPPERLHRAFPRNDQKREGRQ